MLLPMRKAVRTCVASAVCAAIFIACGARTGLPVGEGSTEVVGPPKSSGFCVHADYRAGFSDVSIHMILDKSGSMLDGNKWSSATAALSALVDDPSAAGLGFGLQYFPLGASCDADKFAIPEVPIAPLPTNAARVKASLARQTPGGDTPTLPAIRGGLEYARAQQLADPTRAVVLALLTDGRPDDCESTTQNVAATASQGATSDPRVLTFVIGLANGYVDAMNSIAAAGGTGKAILINEDPMTAQQLVKTMKELRDTQRLCRYAVPSPGDATMTQLDLTITYKPTPDEKPIDVPLVAGQPACGANGGFYVDDPARPTLVALCPSTCSTVHAASASSVNVTAGCGLGAPDGGVFEGGDGGGFCTGIVQFDCVPFCGSTDLRSPVCVGRDWVCPSGTVSTDACTSCTPIPHGCCKGDGTLAQASCVNGNWVCPPGSNIFGSPGCTPPAVCAPLLPCGPGQYCKTPDFSCGTGSVAGSCAPIPSGCAPGAQACGCDGQLYTSTCAAASVGVDLSNSGSCTIPGGTFACGPLFCRNGSEVCEHIQDFTKGAAPNSFACLTAPCNRNACPTCPAGRACTSSCSGDGTVLTCTVL